jgi:F-type H+-transporting ATPase subunit delta
MKGQSRRRVAQFIADKLATGESVSQAAKILAAWLVDGRRVRDADLLLRDIESELLLRHGHLAVNVISARELSASIRSALSSQMEALSDAKTIEILPEVDTSLLGGLIVRTPDAEMDASLRTKLDRLRTI